MVRDFSFKILKKSKKGLGRAGILHTLHGDIQTPAFVAVGTQATVKALTVEMIKDIGLQVVLANTYHLYLRPGDKIVKKAGGLAKFMNWNGPTMTDSGGFQVFSLGKAFESKVNKFSNGSVSTAKNSESLVKISEEGVSFKSPYDGSKHFFTPEKSIQIQNNIGADIIFAFDECPSPNDSKEYQIEAMERTHRWAVRSLVEHKRTRGTTQNGRGLKQNNGAAIFGIVQGGKFKDLRRKSAEVVGKMDFDGYGIGGTFNKKDIKNVIEVVNKILPEEKPKHLLGIGEIEDLREAIKSGCDLFDCVAPTRMGRNGTLHTKKGKINITNTKFRDDFSPIEKDCGCYACKNYTKAYLAHLFHSNEMLAGTLSSVHNLYFVSEFVKNEREKILNEK